MIFLVLLVNFSIIGSGMAIMQPKLETDLMASFQQVDTFAGKKQRAYEEAVSWRRTRAGGGQPGEEEAEERRLQGGTVAMLSVKRIRLIYVPIVDEEDANQNDNLLTLERLKEIKEVEDGLRDVLNYQTFCEDVRPAGIELWGNGCSPGESLTGWLWPRQKWSDGEVHESQLIFDATGSEMQPLSSVLKYLAETDRLPVFFPDVDKETIDERILGDVPYANVLSSRFTFVLGRDVAAAAEMDKALTLYQTFIEQQVYGYLSNYVGTRVRVHYAGNFIEDHEKIQVMYEDIYFCVFCLIPIFIIILLHTKSLFLSVAALFTVPLSVPLGYVIFALISGQTSVSLVNCVGVFFCVGIGMDHIFVFTDAWTLARLSPKAKKKKTKYERSLFRMQLMYRQSLSACSATTFATAMSFTSFVLFPIPVLREFGSFMSLTIVLGLVETALLWPPIMYIYKEKIQKWFRRNRQNDQVLPDEEVAGVVPGTGMFNPWDAAPEPSPASRGWDGTPAHGDSPEVEDDGYEMKRMASTDSIRTEMSEDPMSAKTRRRSITMKTELGDEDLKSLRANERFLYSTWSTVVFRYRFRVLYGFVTLVLIMAVAIVFTISFDTDQTNMFPEDHNQNRGLLLNSKFPGETSDGRRAFGAGSVPEGRTPSTYICDGAESPFNEKAKLLSSSTCTNQMADTMCGFRAITGQCQADLLIVDSAVGETEAAAAAAAACEGCSCEQHCGLCDKCFVHVCQVSDRFAAAQIDPFYMGPATTAAPSVPIPTPCQCYLEPVNCGSVRMVPGFGYPARFHGFVAGKNIDAEALLQKLFSGKAFEIANTFYLLSGPCYDDMDELCSPRTAGEIPAEPLTPLVLQDWLSGATEPLDFYSFAPVDIFVDLSGAATALPEVCDFVLRCYCAEGKYCKNDEGKMELNPDGAAAIAPLEVKILGRRRKLALAKLRKLAVLFAGFLAGWATLRSS
jgi:hypothetical protein